MRSLVALLSRLAPPAAALILLVSGCTDEKIVYRDREAFNPPPEEALGFLGYFAATDQQTTCGNCHVGQQAEWAGTRHAGAWATLQASGHAQAFCEGCHTVNQLGNAATEPSGYAAVPDTSYHDVQCESCHGAGLDHVMNPDGTQPLASIKAALDADNGCGECHQGTHHPFVEEWEQSAHATPVQTVVDRAVSDPAHYGTCVDCHTAQGALAAWGIRDEYVEKNDPVQNHLGIVCAVCHDPHNGDFEGQTRFPVDVPSQEQNLCIKCHYKRAEPEVGAEVIRGPHSPEGPLLLGEGAGWFPPGFEPEVDRILGTHGTDNNPRLCATCHIYNYEVTDQATGEFLVQSVGHLFNAIPCVDAQGVPTPETDCDVSQRQFGGCTESGCHGSPDAARSAYLTANQRIADLVAEVDALLAQPAVAADFNLNDGVFTVADGAWFNNELAKLPGTPTHNPFLAEQLLVASINAIQATYGVTAPLTGISLERQLR